MKKDDFLANQTNKQRFINLLSDDLQWQHNDVLHARADADVLTVETAIACANTKDTVVVGDDTDLLVLLCSRAGPTSHNLFVRPEPKLTSRRQARCWNIEQVIKTLGRHVCDKLLVADGLLGCDTTLRLYSIGKSAAVRISLGFWQRSTLQERRKRMSSQLERMPWFACTMASPGKHWTY